MDEVKDKFKGLVKKINNPFVPSGRFRGEGHRLGSGEGGSLPSSSTNGGDGNRQGNDLRKLQQERYGPDKGTPQRSEYGRSTLPTKGNAVTGPPPSHKGSGHSEVNGCVGAVLPSDARNADLDAKKSSECLVAPSLLHKDCATAAPLSQTSLAMVVRSPETDIFETLQAQGLNEDAGPTNRHHEYQTSTGFNPFSSHIGVGRKHGDLQMFQCPVCGNWWKSETEINAHVEECLNQGGSLSESKASQSTSGLSSGLQDQTKAALGAFLSGGPANATLDVMIRILRNVLNSPEQEKYRKIRLSNPKIQESIGMALGGVELLESVGFDLQTEGEEVWAMMKAPSLEQIEAMKEIASALEAQVLGLNLSTSTKDNGAKETVTEAATAQRNVDRQVRVFYAAPENLAAQMDLPNSFFQLSAAELRQEAATRRKRLEDSQLLVPKSFREKKAAERKNMYKAAIVRIQFPDGVILQGMFLPWERTTAIYEFVASSLRDPATIFNLVAPALSRNQIIPSSAIGTGQVPTLSDANLVPATLIKFQCSEADSPTFTGLHPDLLLALEPLSSTTLRMK